MWPSPNYSHNQTNKLNLKVIQKELKSVNARIEQVKTEIAELDLKLRKHNFNKQFDRSKIVHTNIHSQKNEWKQHEVKSVQKYKSNYNQYSKNGAFSSKKRPLEEISCDGIQEPSKKRRCNNNLGHKRYGGHPTKLSIEKTNEYSKGAVLPMNLNLTEAYNNLHACGLIDSLLNKQYFNVNQKQLWVLYFIIKFILLVYMYF